MKVKGLFYPSLRTLLTAGLLLAAAVVPAGAQGHTSLTPLLIKLDGWQAEEPEGMTMNTGGINMVTATRKYVQGQKELDAMLMVGNQPMAMGQQEQMSVDTAHGRMRIRQINGFQVHTTLDKRDNSGGVMVVLGKKEGSGAMFILTFKGISDEEALKIAKKFDWQAMRKQTAKLLAQP
ncbi:MAG: hypothetical protein JRJ56_01115 [Deltaproteobacteria bacterium]|jgi:hypothetical protein|nr:hypothetical protein [Deltaproteobacteria bacterium]